MKLAKIGGCGLALALSASAPAAAATVKVGVVLTYSGNGAEFGQQIQRGMDLYLAEAGQAKLGAHQIELIKRDAKGPSGDVAKTAVQELIVREKVDLLTGFVFSPNIIASAPLIEQAKVPTLILNAATAGIPSLSPHLARVSMTMWQTGYPMGQYAFQKLGCQSAAVGYTDYPPGKDALEAFQTGFEQAGGGSRTRCRWAARPRCPTSRRSCSGSRMPGRTASTCSCRPATTRRRCSRPTPSSAWRMPACA